MPLGERVARMGHPQKLPAIAPCKQAQCVGQLPIMAQTSSLQQGLGLAWRKRRERHHGVERTIKLVSSPALEHTEMERGGRLLADRDKETHPVYLEDTFYVPQ